MYEWQMTSDSFVSSVLGAINALPAIPEQTVVATLNDLLQRLYTLVIRPLRSATVNLQKEGDLMYFVPKEIATADLSATVCTEDIDSVIADGKALLAAKGDQFFVLPFPMYFGMAEKIYVRNVDCEAVTVVYVARPAPISYEDGAYTGSICLPNGYETLLEAGLRAELCRYMADEEGCRLYAEKFNDMLSELKTVYGKEGK